MVIMRKQLARFFPAVALIALAACAGSGGSGPAVAVPEPAPAATPAVAPAAAPAATPVPEEPPFNRLKWSTASEVDNYGFDVYRGESEDGPFVRLTPAPVEGGGTTDEPRSYVFVDDTIDPYRTYDYYVESISMSGARERFTPIAKAGPKLPAS